MKFDAIVGNPPWGAVKPAIREFVAIADPTILEHQGFDLREAVARSVPSGAEGWKLLSEQSRSYRASATRLQFLPLPGSRRFRAVSLLY